MDPPSSPDRVNPLATHVVPSPVAAISSLGHASAPAHALTGTAAGGPLNGFAASSSPFQSAAPKEIVPLARVGESALPVPGAPHPPAITAPSAGIAAATSSIPFPTDDALGHLSGSAMPGFPVLQPPTPHQPVGADPSHSELDPHLLLGYDPLGTVGEMVQLPCQTTLHKVCSSQYVELWHFTAEGMAAGFRKGANISDAGKRLMDQLGTELELPKAVIPDECMPFQAYFHASRKHVDTIRHVARQQIDPTKRTLLMNEAAIWTQAYENITSRVGSWAMTAKYSALLRHYYYSCTIGMTRPNPSLWQARLWEHVIAIRQGNLWEGTLPYEPIFGLPGSAPPQPHPTPLPTYNPAPVYAPTLAHAPTPPYHPAYGHASGSSRGASRPPARGQQKGAGRPFRPSPHGGSRNAMGACFICGRTQSEFPHDVQTCTTPPAGRSTPFAYRDEYNHLLRTSDNSSIWRTTLNSVDLLIKLRPELANARRPLNPDGFDRVLRSLNLMDDYGDLVEGFRGGFDFGIPPIQETRTPPNHLSATENMEGLDQIAAKELEKGRWAGPYSREEIEKEIGPFQSSPMGLIPKPNGDWRLVQDLSYPRNGSYLSINSYIVADEYLTTWDDVTTVFVALRELSRQVQGATFDAMEAFRGILALASQLPGLIVQLREGVFYYDFFLPFGLASATGVWGRVADCVKAIITTKLLRRVRIFRWVDDFLVVRLDPSIQTNDIIAATEGLDFPWNPAKTTDFRPDPKYVGWVFRVAERKVVLPRDKAEKYGQRALSLKQKDRIKLSEVLQLHGSLQHVAFVARDLRPFLAELGRFAASWPENQPFRTRSIPPEVKKECNHWVVHLAQIPFVRSFAPPARSFPLTVWVDASTEWGIGVIVGERWRAWRWIDGWKRDGRGIGWGEAVALELGMRAAIAQGAKCASITFRSDNQGVIACYKLGRSRNKQINTVLKRVVDLERDFKVRLDIAYIETDSNPADGPSRGVLPTGPRLPNFKIPPPLAPYLHAVPLD
ncbi:hypothetical protein CF319_g8450 [Tilletia indica]|nr:hypothetical protein CF319_g8450 [Tilletia indica]